jgi:exopolysaccharide biosynthesis predicted pyruvyltransferase EpsI
MNESKMSEEFHDWLDQCPVHWIREQHDQHKKTASYYFWQEDKENEE